MISRNSRHLKKQLAVTSPELFLGSGPEKQMLGSSTSWNYYKYVYIEYIYKSGPYRLYTYTLYKICALF